MVYSGRRFRKYGWLKIILLPVGCSFILISAVFAAEFNLSPATGRLGLKQEFSVDIKINTNSGSINAAQAKIKFDPVVLEVKGISKDNSIFNFWLQEPVFSNTDGTVQFIGGTTSGVSGAALEVLKINFISKGVGLSEISFVDGAITASDGSGTNVLDKSNGAKFDISSSATVPAGEIAPATTPVSVVRKPIAVAGLPATPEIRISLYPDPEKWYGVVSEFTPFWSLSPDISGVSAAFNTNPYFVPPAVSEGLFESKTYPAIVKDGVYYFHIRFQNNKGWGPPAHYRIAVDTQPPVSFKIDTGSGLASDNPSPKLSFSTTDSLSGIDHYDVIVDSDQPSSVHEPEYSFPPRKPGEYIVRVRAVDKAGNSIEDGVKIEILPIESPSLVSISEKVVIGSDIPLTIKGTSIPRTNVVITMTDQDKFLVLQEEAKPSSNGEWELRLDRDLKRGNYFVSILAKDSRGAVSLPTDPVKVKFVEKPAISIFGLELIMRDLVVILISIVTAGAIYSWRKTLIHLARSQRETIIISRDLKNAFDLIKKDLGRMADMLKRDSVSEEKKLEVDATNKKVSETLDKIEKYLSKDIEKLD